jgi:hypothetical protein
MKNNEMFPPVQDLEIKLRAIHRANSSIDDLVAAGELSEYNADSISAKIKSHFVRNCSNDTELFCVELEKVVSSELSAAISPFQVSNRIV